MKEQELVQPEESPWCSVEVGFDAKGSSPRVKSVKLKFDSDTELPKLRNKAIEAVQAALAAVGVRTPERSDDAAESE